MTAKDVITSFPEYIQTLRMNEIKEKSIQKYLRDLKRFLSFLIVYDYGTQSPSDHKGQKLREVNFKTTQINSTDPAAFLVQNSEKLTADITKYDMIAYKAYLLSRYKPSSINSYLLSLNRYMAWSENPDLKLKLERIQRRCSLNHVLEMEDYQQLLTYAEHHGKWKYYYIMKTLAGTGIRVGELKYITKEAVEAGLASVRHKGKNREICIPEGLCRALLCYCAEHQITSGIIFTGRDGHSPLDESGVWKSLKRLAAAAKVDACRVYPHSFRHFFAKTYMREIGNLTELCDILGHSSIETTRIYTKESAREKRESLSRLSI